MRDSVVFYRSFYDAVKDLPPEDFKKSVQAIMGYGLDGIEPETTGIEKTIFLLTKPQIDANNRRYQNGSKGGRPKKNQKAAEPEPSNNQNKTKAEPSSNLNETKAEPKEKEKVNVKVKDKVKDNKYTCAFEALWNAYPRKKDKGLAYKAYRARLNDGFSEDELETAVKRYADECRRQRTEERYIKHCSTFLGVNTPFMDYLRKDDQNDTGGKTGADEGYIQRLVESGVRVDFDGF